MVLDVPTYLQLRYADLQLLYVTAQYANVSNAGFVHGVSSFSFLWYANAMAITKIVPTLDAIVVLLLLWNPKRNAGYKGLLRNAFGALLISILMTSSYFYCLSALHEKLIPGVDFQDWFDLERGFLDATEGFNGGLEEDVSRETLDHVDL